MSDPASHLPSGALDILGPESGPGAGEPSPPPSLLFCLARLAQLQSEVVDRLALQEATSSALTETRENDVSLPVAQLETVARHLQIKAARWFDVPDEAALPLLIWAEDADPGKEWGLLRGRNGQGQWVSEWWDTDARHWQEQADNVFGRHRFAAFRLTRPFVASDSPLYRLISDEIFSHRPLLKDVVIGGLMINIIALATSFYSMQVYDRVVPTGSSQTLLVLTLGVLVAMAFEWVARHVRSGLYERLIDQVDQRLARTVFLRLLGVRLDQMPQSVGGLAGQMRGYESVRGFFTSVTTNFLVDAPFAIFFALIIALIGGWLALIPLLFLAASIAIGLHYRRQIDALAEKSTSAGNLKTGLLVETVEGAEAIKSGQGGWRMLSRWMKTTDDARDAELRMRQISENAQHTAASFQQVAYTLLVASGALLIGRGDLTMGSLIACSILSGRVLSPVAMIPAQLVQWANTKAALQGLDRLWALQDDHHGQSQPVILERINGHYRFESAALSYRSTPGLSVPELVIQPGEKIGVIGPVGAGKTTLLRLLSGMYKPQEGRILLDDIDLSHLSKPLLAAHLAYVQQDGRLFSGTLRENLILGQIDPGDEVIMEAARKTGLLDTVIKQNPKGLQQEIFEGGSGLSGGQRQLVNLTRAFLRRPAIWLLDEPTASMDRSLEDHVRSALKESIGPHATLVLVTHKAEMLDLVDRLIVIANRAIVLDGPKLQVLQRLQGGDQVPQQRAA